jgi:hypothetical protein
MRSQTESLQMSAISAETISAQSCHEASLCGFDLLENFLPLYEKAEISSSVRSQHTPNAHGLAGRTRKEPLSFRE